MRGEDSGAASCYGRGGQTQQNASMPGNILAKVATERCCFPRVCYTARNSWQDAGELHG